MLRARHAERVDAAEVGGAGAAGQHLHLAVEEEAPVALVLLGVGPGTDDLVADGRLAVERLRDAARVERRPVRGGFLVGGERGVGVGRARHGGREGVWTGDGKIRGPGRREDPRTAAGQETHDRLHIWLGRSDAVVADAARRLARARVEDVHRARPRVGDLLDALAVGVERRRVEVAAGGRRVVAALAARRGPAAAAAASRSAAT